MRLVLILWAMTASQQLTWYEFYERGEKHFAKEEYRLCIADMNRALSQKPHPARHVFTRAVQKIDYKPFYYKAMAYYQLGDLSQAYQYAQRAFRAPVVDGLPLLQSDLGKILEDYSAWMEGENTRLGQERQSLEARQKVTKLAAQGRLQEASEALKRLEAEDPSSYVDLRLVIDNQLNYKREELELRSNLYNSINQAIQNGAWDSARKLIDLGSDNLPIEARQQWSEMIRMGEAFETANTTEDSTSSRLDTERDDDQILLAPYRQELDDYAQRVLELEQLQTQTSAEVDRVASENDLLIKQLASKPVDVPGPPRLIIAAQRERGRRVRVEAQVIADLPVQDWRLLLNGQVVQVPVSDWRLDDNGLSLMTAVVMPAYGSHKLVLEARDALGRTERQLRQIMLPTPFWLQAWFIYMLVGLPIMVMLLGVYWWWKRRRKAHLQNFNPYIAGSPVRQKDMFYGRDQLLSRIQGLVHKNCFMIHGERRIGKTSLLLQLKTNLVKSQSSQYAFYPVFIDLQGIREEELFHHFMGEIIVQAADWSISLEDLDFRDQHDHYQNRYFSRDIKRIIGRLRQRTEKHVVVVLLVDEVDVLNEFGDKTNQKLRGIFMKEYAEFLSCVMAGIHLKKEWESSGSPWYNFFEEIPIDAIDEKAARKLILRPVRGIFKYQLEAVQHILRSSGGHPYLIQKICVSLVDESLRQKRFMISRQDVERYLINLRKESQKKGAK